MTLIQSAAARSAISREWSVVRRYHNWVKSASFTDGGFLSSQFLDFCHSLVLIHSYSVLQKALRRLRKEKVFQAKGSELGVMMEATETTLPWLDFATVDTGRERRNRVAHQGKSLPRLETWSYIRAIERELVHWGVLSEQPPW